MNGTLLGLSVLDPHLDRVSGEAAVRQEWFSQKIQSALACTVTGAYPDFGALT